ncbi:MAG: GNAT family N-acetyltransferase [Bacteroidales bacterium]|nr:GNAT family N-acetyltransferase [Bacteroidales bacterium]
MQNISKEKSILNMDNEIEIKTFDGNLEALRDLLRSAWVPDYSEHKQSVINFALSYLKWNLQNSLSNSYFHIGAYHNDKLVGFAASFPQKYEYVSRTGNGLTKRQISGVLSTFFTTHNEYRRKGLGTMLAKERIRRHIEQGVEINLFYQDHGHASSKVYPKFSGYLKSSYSNLTTVNFLIKVLDIKKCAN